MISSLNFQTTEETDILDITSDVQGVLNRQNAHEGCCMIFCTGSTASISTIEFEPNTVRDLKEAFERLVPKDKYYHHEKTWHDGNGFSHIRASLMKPGMTVPYSKGELCLGTWQQIILMDFDNKPRSRRVLVQLIEEK